jgi:hypothetical protein
MTKSEFKFFVVLCQSLFFIACGSSTEPQHCENSERETIKLEYDDGSFELGRLGAQQDQILFVHFSAPCYPADLLEVEMRLCGTDTFELGVWDFSSGDGLKGKTVSGISDSSYEWITFDLRDLMITLDSDFWVGLTYTGKPAPLTRCVQVENPSRLGWYPAISCDTSSSSRSAFAAAHNAIVAGLQFGDTSHSGNTRQTSKLNPNWLANLKFLG